ncbi:MAG: FapA family protein, partial [Deltaproteobacteria bacterium]|nr:FapA family protein [Deltaproteobacteria bacterium]
TCTLNALSELKLAATSGGTCSPSTIVDSSTGSNGSGTVDLTLTWTDVKCVDPSTGNAETFNGSVSITGNYDSGSGSVSINTSIDLTMGTAFTAGGSVQVSVTGSLSENGNGLVQGTTNISFATKGSVSLSGSVTNAPSGDACNDTITGSFSGWEAVDDAFSGSPSQLAFDVDDGNETTASGTSSGGGSASLKEGSYSKASITIALTSQTTKTVNGTGTFGAVMTETGTSACGTTVTSSTSYSGKFTATLTNLTFDDGSCGGKWPTGGTITITANKTFSMDFTGQACGCANVSVNSGTASQVCGIQ